MKPKTKFSMQYMAKKLQFSATLLKITQLLQGFFISFIICSIKLHSFW